MNRHFAFLLIASTAITTTGSTIARADWWSRNIAPIGKAVEKGAHDLGHTVEKGVDDAADTIEKGVHDLGHTIEKATDDTGHTIEKGFQDIGSTAEKALHDTGHSLEDAGQFVEDHPWETIAVIAFVAGGAYLIAYQQFALQLTVGEQVVATFTAAELGATSVAAGAATGVMAANRPASTSELYDDTKETESEPEKVALPADNKPAERSVLELPKLNSPAPIMPGNPSNTQKLIFGQEVLRWTRDSQPISTFKPEDYPTFLSPMEQKLLEARLIIETVPDSPADIAAKQQSADRRDFVKDQIADKAKDLLLGKIPDPTDVMKDALIESLKPTILADGWSASRETIKSLLDHELGKYAVKRDPCMKTPFAPACIKPPVEGPTIQAQP